MTFFSCYGKELSAFFFLEMSAVKPSGREFILDVTFWTQQKIVTNMNM